jgi:hypothetical protein
MEGAKVARARSVGPLRGLLTDQKTGKPLVLHAWAWTYGGAANVTDDPTPMDILRGVVGVDIRLAGNWEPEAVDVRQVHCRPI